MTVAGRLACGLAAVVLAATHQATLSAHAGLRISSPLHGSTLGAAPAEIQLTFIERPEPSLTTIRVSDTNGEAYHAGDPQPLAGDPLTLTIAVRTMRRGVYTVHWRVVSAVDGHATAGAFAFGVEVAPEGPAAVATIETAVSWLEVGGRSGFLLGVIIALGAALFELLARGDWPWRRLATIGTLAAAAGVTALAVAQWQVSGAGVAAFAATTVGRASIARVGAVALMACGTAIGGRIGAVVLSLTAIAGILVHAAAGHAAAGRLPVTSTVIVHAIHVAAAGAWIGGLVLLVAGLRNPSGGDRSRSIARFSNLAAIGLVFVTVTGIARSIHEVGAWRELTTTTYGELVLAKIMLLLAIAALGALNRWRHMPAAAVDVQPLRRTARVEIAIAALAVVVAGSLATLPPPAAANALAGMEVSGSDFATTITATLKAVSDQPGPNRFEVTVADYDSGDAITPDRVSLRFTPIDDPGIAPTTLVLSKAAEGVFSGTGANVSFDGRWQVAVLVEHGATSAEVPLEIDARGRPQRVTAHRLPNQPPQYTVELGPLGFVEVIVEPEEPGPSRLQISCFDVLSERRTVRDMIVTIASDTIPVQRVATQRHDRHLFTTAVTLHRGTNRIAVIARTESGTRLRATLELKLPDRD